LSEFQADLDFQGGAAETILRVPNAHFWSPQDPHLYPLTVTLGEGQPVIASYTLEVGVRSVEVRREQLLLNSQPTNLKGFGKYEDFLINGRGLNLPLVIRDFELGRRVGANAYRAAHYPHSEEERSLADRLGCSLSMRSLLLNSTLRMRTG
jgi:beta-glucuronidase